MNNTLWIIGTSMAVGAVLMMFTFLFTGPSVCGL